jgi:PAS domain S-box-containing protein
LSYGFLWYLFGNLAVMGGIRYINFYKKFHDDTPRTVCPRNDGTLKMLMVDLDGQGDAFPAYNVLQPASNFKGKSIRCSRVVNASIFPLFQSNKNNLQETANFIDQLSNILRIGDLQIKGILVSFKGKSTMSQMKTPNNNLLTEEKPLIPETLIKYESATIPLEIFYIFLVAALVVILFVLLFILYKNKRLLQNAFMEIDELYNHAPCGYHSLDKGGNIIHINDKVLEWAGYTGEEMIGRNIKEILKPRDREMSAKPEGLVQEKDVTSDEEHDLICKDGSLFPVIINSLSLNHDKGVFTENTYCVFDNRKGALYKREITRLNKELEKLTDCLLTANNELNSFSYSISHDLRAPLRAILGYSSILQEEYENLLDEEGRRVIEIIGKNARKMGELIEDLLTFSHMGKDLVRTEADLEQLVRSVLTRQLALVPAQRKMEIEILPIGSAFVDVELMKTVWANLISNAIKYSSTREKASIKIGKKMENGLDIYYVEDNGVGFDMFYVDKLFGVFQRLHKQKEFDGNGIGLAIVKRIIQKHGGTIWAHSQVGEGASFYFTLPKQSII